MKGPPHNQINGRCKNGPHKNQRTPRPHTYRQDNQTAINLMRLGDEPAEELVVTDSQEVPPSAREYLIADSLGVGQFKTFSPLF